MLLCNIDSIVHNIPLSFIRSGNYYWFNGTLLSRQSYGYYWSSRVSSITSSRSLYFYGTYVNPRANATKGRGFVVRYVAHKKENSANNIDSIVHNIPLSFIRGGNYRWSAGSLGNRRSGGLYWSSRAYSGSDSRYLTFVGTAVNPRNSNNKGFGYVVRCVES